MLFNLLVMTASALFYGGDESRVLVKTLSGSDCCAALRAIYAGTDAADCVLVTTGGKGLAYCAVLGAANAAFAAPSDGDRNVYVVGGGAVALPTYNVFASGDGQVIRTSPGGFGYVIASPSADGAVAFAPGAFGYVTVSPSADGAVAFAPGAFGYVVTTGDEDDDRVELPSVWIGVRTAPVPAALAAHVGDAGVMVANVVVDSPADAAGLEQYDIIVAFNGADIDEPNDLLEAIGKAGTKRVRISVLRGGKKSTLRIKAAKRAATPGDITFKYDEPADIIDDQVKTRGGVLRLLPGGKLEIKSLGDLKNLPDKLKAFGVFKDLHDGNFHAFNFDALKDLYLDMDDFGIDLDDLKWNLHGNIFKVVPNFDGNFSFQFKMQVDDDGETISITRDSDGKITVERTDEDGDKTTTTYDSDEEFEQDDPDAFERFGKGGVMRFNFGGMKGLHVLPNFKHRLKFQGRWKEQIEKALENLNNTNLRLRRLYDADEKFDAQSQAVAIKLGTDGSIEVTVSEDGKKQTYSFDSKEDFEDSEPDLYERFKEFFE